MNTPTPDFRTMTADSIGKDMLSALVTEIKLLPDPWVKLSKAKQDDVIDRLRSRVESNVKMAVHLLAAEGRIVVAGDLDQITIKDGVKAVVKFGSGAANLHELYDVAGKAVLVVVANAAEHIGGMDEVHGESDQRAMDLGNEYDPNGDGKGMDDGNTIDSEAKALPGPGDVAPTEEELQEHYELGYTAASEGQPESECPIVRSALVIEWIRGFRAWHEEQATELDPLYEQAATLVVNEQRVSISLVQRHLRIGYNRAARLVESLEKNGVVSAQGVDGSRIVLVKGEGKAA